MKQPLVWFALIGALLFTADQFTAPDLIVVDDAVKTQIANLWEAQMRVAPSDEELDALVQNWLREEVFYREALRLSLDKDDTIIRRRLVQKLGFLAQEVDESTLTEDDVKRYYERKIANYTQPERYSLSQVYFSNRSDLVLTKTKLDQVANWQLLGESALLPRSVINKSKRELTSTFGEAFTGQLDQLVQGQWVGPITSTFGYHLVRLQLLAPEAATPLAAIKSQVLSDLIQARREQSLKDYYQDLLDQYDVEYR